MHRAIPQSLYLALIACLPLQAAENPGGEWKAGAAQVVITPDKSLPMAGGQRPKPAEGKLHDLWAKALALEDPGGRRAVLITVDLIGIRRSLAVEVCNQLHKKHRLPREAIILAASHTHSGPVTIDGNLDGTQKDIDDYTRSLQTKLVQVVEEAMGKLAPARLTWSIGRSTFAVNRRNNRETEVPRLREEGRLRGPVDHEVPVLAIRSPAGRVQAVVFGYACHATALNMNGHPDHATAPFFYRWSGDYPAFAQSEVESAYPGAVALFWAGCGGDQNPLPRRSVERAQAYAKQLAGAVKAELDRPMNPVVGRLAMAYREIDLPFDALPSRERLIQDSGSSNPALASWAKRLLKKYEQQGSLSANYPYPVQVWKLGDDVYWIALGGEAVVDYSLRLKREVSPGKTWVMSYANDVMAYIPSLRVLKEGGYESGRPVANPDETPGTLAPQFRDIQDIGGSMIGYGHPSAWSPQIEERIVSAVQELVQKVRVNSP